MADDDDKKNDFLLWKLFTKDVDPMRDPNWSEKEKELVKAPSEGKKKTVIERILPKDKEEDKTARDFTASDFQMDKKTEERLRKGKIPIEATLDLHGKNQAQAREALERFVLEAVRQKKRCLLVITGKGKTGQSADQWMVPGEGVLKKKVPDWLFMAPMGQHVLKFVPARPSHGGAGALYVYLRKVK